MKDPKIIAIIVLVVALIAGGIYAATGGFNNKSNNQEQSADSNRNNDVEPTKNLENNIQNSDDKCAYLSNKAAAAGLGVEEVEVTVDNESCTFVSKNTNNYGMLIVGVSEIGNSEKAVYLSEIGKSIDPNITEVSVEGSDSAYWLPGYYQLHSIKNNKLVIVSVVNAQTPKGEELVLFTIISEEVMNNL